MRHVARAAACVAALALLAAPAAHAKVGALTQLKGNAGCIANNELIAGCAHARFGGGQISDVAVSRDGRNVYVAGIGGGVTVFAAKNGSLRQLRGKAGCLSGTGSHGCTRVPELFRANDITVTRDGRNVYVASADRSRGFGGIVAFARDRHTGALRLSGRAGCVGEQGPTCAPAKDVFALVESIAVTPDGGSVYVGSNDAAPGGAQRGGIAVFDRNTRTGRLTQVDGLDACLNHRGGDGCRPARGLLAHCCSIVATARNVYASSDDGRSVAMSAFERDPNSAVLVQLPDKTGCAIRDGSEGCAAWTLGTLPSSNLAGDLVLGARSRLYFAHGVVTPSSGGGACSGADEHIAAIPLSTYGGAPGGELQDIPGCGLSLAGNSTSLYGVSDFGGSVTIFHGNRSGLLARGGCLGAFAVGCARARNIEHPAAAAVSPGGRRVYVAADDVLGIFKRSLR